MLEVVEETMVEVKQENPNNIDSIILLDGSFQLAGKRAYDYSLCGQNMYSWVSRACPSKPILVNFHQDDDLLETIRPLLKDGEYTLVLYSDTPLITANGVRQIIDFVESKSLAVCKLARGWVLKTEYAKNASSLYALTTYDICANELFRVENVDNLVKASNVLQARINKYHIQNGVNIVAPACSYIDSSVAIESGATIEPFTKISGTTTIGANSKICSNVNITDGKIDQNVIIKSGTTLIRSAVLDNAIVGSNCVITNKSVVGEETIISSNCVLDGSTTNAGCKIGASSVVVNTKIANNVNMGVSVKSLGTEIDDVKIGSGAIIGNDCTLFGGVYVAGDTSVANGKKVERD